MALTFGAECGAVLQRGRLASARTGLASLKRVEAEQTNAATNATARDAFDVGVGLHGRPMAKPATDDWGFIFGLVRARIA